jgi:hypothetical protein
LAASIEVAMFELCRCSVGKEYADKVRTLNSNLKRNAALRAQVRSGAIVPRRLVAMSTTELAPDSLASLKAQLEQQSLTDKVLTKETAAEKFKGGKIIDVSVAPVPGARVAPPLLDAATVAAGAAALAADAPKLRLQSRASSVTTEISKLSAVRALVLSVRCRADDKRRSALRDMLLGSADSAVESVTTAALPTTPNSSINTTNTTTTTTTTTTTFAATTTTMTPSTTSPSVDAKQWRLPSSAIVSFEAFESDRDTMANSGAAVAAPTDEPAFDGGLALDDLAPDAVDAGDADDIGKEKKSRKRARTSTEAAVTADAAATTRALADGNARAAAADDDDDESNDALAPSNAFTPPGTPPPLSPARETSASSATSTTTARLPATPSGGNASALTTALFNIAVEFEAMKATGTLHR